MKKIRNIRKRTLIIAGLVLFILTSIGYASIRPGFKEDLQRGPKPTGNLESSFLYQEVYYSCSKEILGNWVEANIGPQGSPGYYFQPSSHEEFNKYCRADAVIEYHAVIEVLKRPAVNRTIAKYDTTRAWVKALGASYIKDTDYIHRILPDYADTRIHCIIVVHSPDVTRFFLEDGDKEHKYIEVSSAEFLASLNRATDEDVNSFWLGLH